MTEPPFKLLDHLQATIHDLPMGRSDLGRSKWKNDLAIPHGSVCSGRHAGLEVSAERVRVIDYRSTNGTYVNGVRVEEADLLPGDTFELGAAAFTLLPGADLRPELPLQLIVAPATGPAADRAWESRARGLREDDEIWTALYLRWRREQLGKAPFFREPLGVLEFPSCLETLKPSQQMPTEDAAWPIRAAATMCSAPMLRFLRNAYFGVDRAQWFVLAEQAFLETLAVAERGVGPLFACDIAMNHPNGASREHASRALRDVGADLGLDPATYVLGRVPAEATSIADLVAHALGMAHREGSRWTGERFARFMERPSFTQAAEWVVFTAANARDEVVTTFRALEGGLITLDDVFELHPEHHVSVAQPAEFDSQTRDRWNDHLAEFEVVQPFPQFGE